MGNDHRPSCVLRSVHLASLELGPSRIIRVRVGEPAPLIANPPSWLLQAPALPSQATPPSPPPRRSCHRGTVALRCQRRSSTATLTAAAVSVSETIVARDLPAVPSHCLSQPLTLPSFRHQCHRCHRVKRSLHLVKIRSKHEHKWLRFCKIPPRGGFWIMLRVLASAAQRERQTPGTRACPPGVARARSFRWSGIRSGSE